MNCNHHIEKSKKLIKQHNAHMISIKFLINLEPEWFGPGWFFGMLIVGVLNCKENWKMVLNWFLCNCSKCMSKYVLYRGTGFELFLWIVFMVLGNFNG